MKPMSLFSASVDGRVDDDGQLRVIDEGETMELACLVADAAGLAAFIVFFFFGGIVRG